MLQSAQPRRAGAAHPQNHAAPHRLTLAPTAHQRTGSETPMPDDVTHHARTVQQAISTPAPDTSPFAAYGLAACYDEMFAGPDQGAPCVSPVAPAPALGRAG
ncbi:MAG: hypothetical protein R2854_03035 [Caldilineaceae bacterium]